MSRKFKEMGLSINTLKAIEKMGFVETTPIQEKSIPVMMKGKDVIGQAHTGTGKTAAFGIPLIESLDFGDNNVQGLILCPTRELAVQVTEELKMLSLGSKLTITSVYGGSSMERQIKALKNGTQIVVGTPGRIMDHMRRKTLILENVKTVVLDEADRMLDMGFQEDIRFILSHIEKERQIVMFSATMPSQIISLAREFQNKPEIIKVITREMTVAAIEQYYLEVGESRKVDALTRLVEYYDPNLSLVFCNTKKKVDELVPLLQKKGFLADGLHGDLTQSMRDRVMNAFRRGTLRILVATDVAARGIDVNDIEAVFNYDVPQDSEYYVHRIGRTGRAGKSGRAFTFAYGRSVRRLRDIQRYTKINMQKIHVPSNEEINTRLQEAFLNNVSEVLEKGNLENYETLINKLVEKNYSPVEIAAALLKMSMNDHSDEEIQEEVIPSGVMTKLFVNVGKKHSVRVGDLVGAVTGETGLPGKVLGDIKMLKKHSYIEVESNQVNSVLQALNRCNIKGNKITAELSRA
ncbi:MAG: DEAD/DEAH box helicase [Kosmotogaceae bacterium]